MPAVNDKVDCYMLSKIKIAHVTHKYGQFFTLHPSGVTVDVLIAACFFAMYPGTCDQFSESIIRRPASGTRYAITMVNLRGNA